MFMALSVFYIRRSQVVGYMEVTVHAEKIASLITLRRCALSLIFMHK
jgi:hypothetical protein